MQLVANKNKTMSSLEIAKLVNSKHRDVRVSIERLVKQGIISTCAMHTYKNINNLDVEGYAVTKRDSYVVVAQLSPEFTGRLVDRWQELENKETERLQGIQDRSELRLEFRPMTDAIADSREGKEIKFYHFSNECDLINKIALGCTSKQYRDYNDIPKNDPIRDHLTPEQKKCVLALQRANTVYLLEGEDFDKRKKRLSSLYERQHARPLLEELIRLEA